MPASGASPAERPNRFTRGNRFYRTAVQTSSSGSENLIHVIITGLPMRGATGASADLLGFFVTHSQ
jgi:hypothetical protein